MTALGRSRFGDDAGCDLNGTWERTIAVGDSEELRLENPAATLSDGGVDTSLDLQWHLTARHAFAGPVDLLRGTHTGLETNDSSETTTDSDASRDTVASGDRSPTTVPLLVSGAALLLGAAGLLLRSRKPDDGSVSRSSNIRWPHRVWSRPDQHGTDGLP